MRQVFVILPFAWGLFLFSGCETTHRVETVSEVKPIHITVDVNLKVDKELNDFFGDLDQQSNLIDYEEPAHSSTQN